MRIYKISKHEHTSIRTKVYYTKTIKINRDKQMKKKTSKQEQVTKNKLNLR